MNTTRESLTVAGWKPLPDGRWASPLTGHAYPEKVARLLQGVPGLTTASQLVRRARRRYARR